MQGQRDVMRKYEDDKEVAKDEDGKDRGEEVRDEMDRGGFTREGK